MTPITINEVLNFLAPELAASAQPPSWPPDAFAVAAFILLKSGSYLKCKIACAPDRQDVFSKIGATWRMNSLKEQTTPEVDGLWKTLIRYRNLPIDEIWDDKNAKICNALLDIVAAADEASTGIGVSFDDPFLARAVYQLALINQGRTLCKLVHWSRACVLPKLHTPRSGLTIRSLSHHVSLFVGGEIIPRWDVVNRLDELRGASKLRARKRHSVNLLLLPWPEYVAPSHFDCSDYVLNGSDKFGYFTYNVRGGGPLKRKSVVEIFKAAQSSVGSVDGVVFPELALKDNDPYEIHKSLSVFNPNVFLIGGVSSTSKPNRKSKEKRKPSTNSWVFVRQFPTKPKSLTSIERQEKHHRWRLDESQILQYGLGGQLNPEVKWWEHTELNQRELVFFSIHPWLNVCVLICEDLARQDPVSDLLRAVGPNLVIALLMDGPQLANRWSARYATVLADDPGSSVITLTSLGMSELSRPPRADPNRTVALWKDARSGQAREISIPKDKRGVVLCMTRQELTEYTVDGRSDYGAADHLILSGVHFV